MWNMKITILSIVIGALSTVTEDRYKDWRFRT